MSENEGAVESGRYSSKTKKPNCENFMEEEVQGQVRRESQAEQGGQCKSELESFNDGVPQRLPVGFEKPPEFDRAVGMKFACNIRLPESV